MSLSLRWGLGAGVISAILGLLALIAGALAEPIHTVTNAYAVALALFVRGLLALLALAMALALAYYAGWQVETRLTWLADEGAAGATVAPGGQRGGVSAARTQAALVGAVALVIYWLITTLYIVILGSRFGGVGAQGASPLAFSLSHLAQGIVFVGLGAGAGGLGGRAAAARRLLQRLTTLASAAAATSPAGATTPAPQASAAASAPTLDAAQPAQPQGDAPTDATDDASLRANE